PVRAEGGEVLRDLLSLGHWHVVRAVPLEVGVPQEFGLRERRPHRVHETFTSYWQDQIREDAAAAKFTDAEPRRPCTPRDPVPDTDARLRRGWYRVLHLLLLRVIVRVPVRPRVLGRLDLGVGDVPRGAV